MSSSQTPRGRPFQQLWGSVSHFLPLSSATAIFLSIWQLKGFLSHFGIQLVSLVTLNDAILQFFVIVSWFLPVFVIAAVFFILPPRGQIWACTTCAGLCLAVFLAAAIAPGLMAFLLSAGPLGLIGAVAEATTPTLRDGALALGLGFGFAALGGRLSQTTDLEPGKAPLRTALRVACDCLVIPALGVSFVIFSLGIGQARAVSEEAQFYVWAPGADGDLEPVRYRSRLLDAPERLGLCRCGGGLIWSGERAVVLKCGARTVIEPDRSDLLMVTEPRTPEAVPRTLSLADLASAPAEVMRKCPATVAP